MWNASVVVVVIYVNLVGKLSWKSVECCRFPAVRAATGPREIC